MVRYFTHREVLTMLRKAIYPSQNQFAAKVGVSPAYLSFVLSGTKPPYRKLLDYLGLVEVTRFQFTGPQMEGRMYARIEDHGTH